MKIAVHRATNPDMPQGPDVLEAPMLFYGCDGDDTLYVHKYDRSGFRLNGSRQYAKGSWLFVEEIEVVAPDLAGKWRDMQNDAVDDPAKIPV